jgi:hypothetical protein
MYKIFISCRNRLAITTKCITAIRRFSKIQHQIYIYDNLTNNKIQEHFMYFSLLYEKKIISQYTVNTKDSTFGAFSKAMACNQFGWTHEQDPNKDQIDFLVFLDNDCIIVEDGWDQTIKQAWADVAKQGLKDIKVIGQLPGGIMKKKDLKAPIAGLKAKTGTSGGSGFWTVKNTFFREVGYLDVKPLIGHDKKHDQNYWVKIGKVTNGRDYILGLDKKIVIHTGGLAGSICNTLTRNKKQNLKKGQNTEELIKFDNAEKEIDSMTFDQFLEKIKNNKTLIGDW